MRDRKRTILRQMIRASDWRIKAMAMWGAALVPGGASAYRVAQSRFGRLAADPMRRLTSAGQIAEALHRSGARVQGKTFMEIGTGHIPRVPLGLYLMGASSIHTFDLHHRLEPSLLGECLAWVGANSSGIVKLFGAFTDEQELLERIGIASRFQTDPWRFLDAADINYHAPGDASATGLDPASIDCAFSVTTLEHIDPASLRKIISECHRTVRNSGLHIHHVDLSDHFAHMDSRIHSADFLRWSPRQWRIIAGNEFAYCNRLQVSHYSEIFQQENVEPQEVVTTVDPVALESLRVGFAVHKDFRRHEQMELAVGDAWFICKNTAPSLSITSTNS